MSKYASPQDSTFHAFLKQAKIPANSKRANVLKAQMLAGGMPFIKTSDDKNLRASFSDARSYEIEPSKFRKGLFGKLHQNEWSHVRGSTPDTLHIKEGDINDMLAELTHAIQFNKPQAARDSLNWENTRQYKELGDLHRYYTPKTVEFQAHREIEPGLRKEYNKANRKDWFDKARGFSFLDYVRSFF